MDELREKILKYLQRWFDGRNPGYHEVHSTVLSVADGIVRESYPEALFHEVYVITKETAEDFVFREGE